MTEHSSSEHTKSSQTRSASYSVRRYFRRSDEPRRWWPFGLLPLLLLGLLFLAGLFFIAPDMQKDTGDRVQSVLQEAGYSQMTVRADGQRVAIKGTANAEDAQRIKRVALGTTCDTFIAKNLVCPTNVDVELEPEQVTRHHNFSFVRNAGGIILRGEVPDLEAHNKVIEYASQFGAVIDSLNVIGKAEDARYNWAANKAWSLLSEVQTGRVIWSDGVLSMVARTAEENEQPIRDLFTSIRFPERIGELDLQFEKDIDACNMQLNNALSETMIFFETASAVISEGSKKQLEVISEIAMSCPGDLVVEGHTDNVGEDDSNLVLSRSRANAVVTALGNLGVSASRLSAIGYGETRPVMSNETPQGRAMNRRIAIRTAEFN
ncbi:MAG: OmpA family protein [Rhodothermaceae bacterium]|nr:OmpA family protein [Rhodothermaceae bacterium]